MLTFKSEAYFLDGFRWVDIDLSGCHGRKKVKVGIGTAYFVTHSTNGNKQLWIAPNSMYMPSCPVNLLCADKIHRRADNSKTGHFINFCDEMMTLKSGSVIPVVRDPNTYQRITKLRAAVQSAQLRRRLVASLCWITLS